MRVFCALLLAMGMASLGARVAEADGLTFSLHEASGSASANVFDGGPPTTQTGSSSGPFFTFGVSDITTPGSLGAGTSASVRSTISEGDGSFLGVQVELLAGYFPSFLPGGDNPGGTAEAELTSVIEFVLPAAEVEWTYRLRINNDQPNPFLGSTSVVVENVTRSETLIALTKETDQIVTTLYGNFGDVIRISSTMEANGSMGPGSRKIYNADFLTQFIVPEATSGTFVMALLAICSRRKRARRR
jgi:hypothetical protein